MNHTTDAVEREAVRDRLDEVHDPELDRSIVDLEYIDAVRIDGGRVHVAFVLPTAWCSPAFAWMMATGIRDEVGSLAGVTDVRVELLDHLHAAEINRGTNEGLAFETVFEDAEDGIDEVRRKLDRKARLVRQHRAVECLLDAGLDPEQITGLTMGDLERDGDRFVISLREGALCVTLPADPVDAYLEKASTLGLVTAAEDRLFLDTADEPIAPEEFEAVHRETRLATSNVSGQAGICAQLHEARNGVDAFGE